MFEKYMKIYNKKRNLETFQQNRGIQTADVQLLMTKTY